MVTISLHDIIQQVSDFKAQLVYGNRFFIKHHVIDVLNEKLKDFELEIEVGKEIFRARVDYKNQLINENFIYSNFLSNNSLDKSKEEMDKINSIEKRIKNNFLGFDKNDSGIPPIIGYGRSQPKYIRYLYLAEDFETAVAEVHPKIGHYVSVAKFRINQKIKIIDISGITLNESLEKQLYNVAEKFTENKCTKEDIEKEMIYISLIYLFLNTDESDDSYIVPNYISALIHSLGYDGLRFSSTVKSNGKNIILFNDKCECISSILLKVNSQTIKADLFGIKGVNEVSVQEFGKYLMPNIPEEFINFLKSKKEKVSDL